jgi:hypothetical protein
VGLHQVVKGTQNFPTAEYAFSGAATYLVDLDTFLDASAFECTQLGDRSLKIGRDTTHGLYGENYGDDHGG